MIRYMHIAQSAVDSRITDIARWRIGPELWFGFSAPEGDVLVIRSPRAVISPQSRFRYLGVSSTQFALGPNSRRVKATFRAFAIYRPKDVLEQAQRANHGLSDGLRLARSVFCRCRYWTTALFGCYEATNPRRGYTPSLKPPWGRSNSHFLSYTKERLSSPRLKG